MTELVKQIGKEENLSFFSFLLDCLLVSLLALGPHLGAWISYEAPFTIRRCDSKSKDRMWKGNAAQGKVL